jgi:hypothetical protein
LILGFFVFKILRFLQSTRTTIRCLPGRVCAANFTSAVGGEVSRFSAPPGQGIGNPIGRVPCSFQVSSDVDQRQPYRDSIRLPADQILEEGLKFVPVNFQSMRVNPGRSPAFPRTASHCLTRL